jgi:hypothetical protein
MRTTAWWKMPVSRGPEIAIGANISTHHNSILPAVTKAKPQLHSAGGQWFCSGAEDDCQGTLPIGIRFAAGLSGWGSNPGRVS